MAYYLSCMERHHGPPLRAAMTETRPVTGVSFLFGGVFLAGLPDSDGFVLAEGLGKTDEKWRLSRTNSNHVSCYDRRKPNGRSPTCLHTRTKSWKVYCTNNILLHPALTLVHFRMSWALSPATSRRSLFSCPALPRTGAGDAQLHSAGCATHLDHTPATHCSPTDTPVPA